LASLTTNKLRSVLTMLGVIIGVGAVIAMLSLGSAFGQLIEGQISWLGTNVLYIRAGQQRRGPPMATQTLTPEDAEALLAVRNVRAVSPAAMNSATIKAGNKSSASAMISGVAPSGFVIENIQIERGRIFTDAEVHRGARVGVIGPKLAEDLFPGVDPVGRDLRIGSARFRVIGLTTAIGDKGGFNPDDRIIIPYTTAMRQLVPRRDHLSMISVSVADKNSIPQVIEDITQLLRRRHRLRAEEESDFSIQSLSEILETLQKVTVYLTLFLGTVAAISLVVGGIGIMNIMLATVAERTREIGIRKALGAKARDILRQFLIEALVITLGGGLLGLLLGWSVMALGAWALHQWAKLQLSATLQWWVVGVSVAVSTAVGLVSGLYPAWRASRLDPIAALRYE
jgi:putative ABC transport system permease protein